MSVKVQLTLTVEEFDHLRKIVKYAAKKSFEAFDELQTAQDHQGARSAEEIHAQARHLLEQALK